MPALRLGGKAINTWVLTTACWLSRRRGATLAAKEVYDGTSIPVMYRGGDLQWDRRCLLAPRSHARDAEVYTAKVDLFWRSGETELIGRKASTVGTWHRRRMPTSTRSKQW